MFLKVFELVQCVRNISTCKIIVVKFIFVKFKYREENHITELFLFLSTLFVPFLYPKTNTPFRCGSTSHYSHYSARFIKCVLSRIVLTAIYLSRYSTYIHIPPRHTIFQVERHGSSNAAAGDIVIVIQTDVARKHIAGVCGKKLFSAFNLDVIRDMMNMVLDERGSLVFRVEFGLLKLFGVTAFG